MSPSPRHCRVRSVSATRVCSLAALAYNDPDPGPRVTVPGECRGGEGSLIWILKGGRERKRRGGGYTVEGEVWGEGAHNGDAVREGSLGVGTLPFWPAGEARRRRSVSSPQPLTCALTLTSALSMVL